MTKTIKILAILGQILFAWIYASVTNYCFGTKCVAQSYIAFLLIVVCFAIFDLYFLKLYPRFKNIPHNILTSIILVFPVLFYFGAIGLNSFSRKMLSVLIIGGVIIILSRVLWMVLARGKIGPKLIEYLALVSFYMLIVAIGFIAASSNFAISSYLKYYSSYNDVYITENNGNKINFIYYKFR